MTQLVVLVQIGKGNTTIGVCKISTENSKRRNYIYVCLFKYVLCLFERLIDWLLLYGHCNFLTKYSHCIILFL